MVPHFKLIYFGPCSIFKCLLDIFHMYLVYHPKNIQTLMILFYAKHDGHKGFTSCCQNHLLYNYKCYIKLLSHINTNNIVISIFHNHHKRNNSSISFYKNIIDLRCCNNAMTF